METIQSGTDLYLDIGIFFNLVSALYLQKRPSFGKEILGAVAKTVK